VKPVDTVVIGGGQAGLATSHHLSRSGRDHVVLDAGRVAETWRTRRWDSFTLVTPNWMINLPGLEDPPGPPEAFLPRGDIVAMLERYARAIEAPIREGVRVQSLERSPSADDEFVVETTAGPIHARRVIVASGFFAAPRSPSAGAGVASSILQLDATGYRRPTDLPDGGVLVVGSGQSGVQIAEDLQLAGRDVWLSVGRAGRFPRRYRGRDGFEWGREIGILEWTEDKVQDPRGRFAPNPHITGARGGHTINLHRFARDGIHLIGRVSAAEGTRLRIDPDLHERLAGVDRSASELKKGLDQWIAAAGVDAPLPDPTNSDDHDGVEGFAVSQVEELDLAAEGIGTVIWAAGMVPDFSWIQLPIFDEQRYPIHDGGVTRLPGLAFVGLRFQRRFKSDLLFGVGDDAAHVVDRLNAQH